MESYICLLDIIPAEKGHVVVRFLLEIGANIDETNQFGCENILRLWYSYFYQTGSRQFLPQHRTVKLRTVKLRLLICWRFEAIDTKNNYGFMKKKYYLFLSSIE